jgi:CheY-like chemotaxis protein
MIDNGSKITIILAEDNDGHATLIERNLERAGLQASFVRVQNGLELLSLFDNEDSRIRVGNRVVVLLDIGMPVLDGTEALYRLKQNSETAPIPVLMLSTTENQREIEKCFRLGCNAYLTKPVAYDALSETIRRLALFLQVSAIPSRRPDLAS